MYTFLIVSMSISKLPLLRVCLPQQLLIVSISLMPNHWNTELRIDLIFWLITSLCPRLFISFYFYKNPIQNTNMCINMQQLSCVNLAQETIVQEMKPIKYIESCLILEFLIWYIHCASISFINFLLRYILGLQSLSINGFWL